MKKLILFAAATMLFCNIARADDPKYEYRDLEKLGIPDAKKPTIWHANMTAGLTWVDGNAYSLGFAGTALVSVRHWNNELTLSGGGAYVKSGKSDYPGGPIVGNGTTARNGILKARYDRYFFEKNAVFASFQSSSDQFAGYWYRLEPQIGYARLLFKSIHQTLRGEVGYDYTFQHDVGWRVTDTNPTPTNPKFERFNSARLFLFYENKFTAYATFSEGLELIEAFEHGGKPFRLNSLTSLSTQIYKAVAIKLNFKLAYNNDPPNRANAPIDPATGNPIINSKTMMPYSSPAGQLDKVDTQLDVVLAVTFL